MRPFRVLRAFSKAFAPLAASVLIASGCQLITGSFSAGGTGTLGPICTLLEKCCAVVAGTSQEAPCLQAVLTQEDTVCAALQSTLPRGCANGTGDGGVLTFPDSGVRHDGFTFGDTSVGHDGHVGSHDAPVVHHDAVGPNDVFVPPTDGGSDAPPPDLDGTWTLTAATCVGGSAISLASGTTTTVTFSTGAAEQEIVLSDGCDLSLDFGQVTITSTEITSMNGEESCGSSCTSTDDCTGGALETFSLPYTVSDGMLNLTQTVDTTTCSSGSAIFTYTMN
jgi:hypothetical protein